LAVHVSVRRVALRHRVLPRRPARAGALVVDLTVHLARARAAQHHHADLAGPNEARDTRRDAEAAKGGSLARSPGCPRTSTSFHRNSRGSVSTNSSCRFSRIIHGRRFKSSSPTGGSRSIARTQGRTWRCTRAIG